MSDHISSVSDGRQDIVATQVWVAIQKIRFRRAFAQLAKKELDRHSGSLYHGLTQHHTRINLNSVVGCHADSVSLWEDSGHFGAPSPNAQRLLD